MLMNTHEARLDALREELREQGLDGFVVPISDEFMSEYVGAYAQRLEWLTGFNGSAGTAVVFTDAARDPAAAVFTDGRYTLQLRDQVDARLYAFESVPETSVSQWLGEHAREGGRIGYDPWLHGKRWVETVNRALADRKAALVATEHNPVDAVWRDRPAPSPAPAVAHPIAHAGVTSEAKRTAVSDWLAKEQLDAVVVTALDSIAWLLNIRGSDIARTPVTLAFVIAHADGAADLYIAPEKVTPALREHLGNAVRIEPREAFVPALQSLAGKRVSVDPEFAVQGIFATLAGAGVEVVERQDPTILPKACKNPQEQAGHRRAQALDGAAMVRFLHWLDGEAPAGRLTEQAAADRLEASRRQSAALVDLSFDTISGSGPNGAIVHYRVSPETNRRLEPDSVFLVDSGGQYPDGTTDITRTVWIGPGDPPADLRDRFTRVLKGNIALSRAVFPKGTLGSQLDALARQHLWQAGLDYAHGTGHGVGSFLSVHEGPARIGKARGGQAGTGNELHPGMILSNEPGYYKAGEYGIRIEHLLMVEPRDIAGAEGEFLGFEVMTLAPVERRLVDPAMLTREELAWWDAYHARVLEVIGPQIDGPARDWLEAQCRPL